MGSRGPIGEGKGHRLKADKQVAIIHADERAEDVPELVGDFSPATRRWFTTWTVAPQAVLFTVTDWQRLLMVAPLVDLYLAEPKATTLAEIRLNEGLLGATVSDRLRAKVEVKPEPAPTPVATDDELGAKRAARDEQLA